jgi:hypothetical protein
MGAAAGTPQLRLAQGRSAAAVAIRRAEGSTTPALEQARILPAFVEIMLAVDDVESARRGCLELEVATSQSTSTKTCTPAARKHSKDWTPSSPSDSETSAGGTPWSTGCSARPAPPSDARP